MMNKEIRVSLVFAAIMLPLAFAAKFAHERGYIAEDTVHRVVALNGLWVVYFGNLIPKKMAPSACLKQVQRFAGWSLVLGGFVYTGFWIFAPIPLALIVGTGAVFASLMATLGYGVWRTRKGSRNTPKYGG